MTFRITSAYLSQMMIGDLNRNLAGMLDQQRMVSTMRRVNSFADDPRAVATIRRYQNLIAENSDYISNASRSRLLVDATDTALQDISEVLADVRVIMLRESSAQATPQTMALSAGEVDSLIERLMSVLNTTIEGNYIFAGTETDAPPFLRGSTYVVYQGNEEDIRSRVGPNTLMTVNLTGNSLIGARSASLTGSTDLAPRLDPTTPLNTLNLGEGWNPGIIQLEDATGAVWQIDLSSALTVGDVLNEINTTTGGAVTATISSDGARLALSGVGPLTVREDSDGTTAASLGLHGTSLAGTLIGRDVRPPADALTALADIENLAGSLPLGSIEIEWQGSVYTVDFSAAATLGDLQAAVATAVPGMELHISPSGLTLVGGSTEEFLVRKADATDSASTLGLLGMGTPVRLFGVLEDLMADLVAGDQLAVRGAASELAALEDLAQELLMRNGNRQNNLDWSESILRAREERLRTNLSLEQDVDIAEVATNLSRAQAAYQASLSVTSTLFQMNLMQYL